MTEKYKNTKFFTNADGNSLYERFNHTLQNAKYFDSLVGYFRTSGFYRLYKSFGNVEKIRILVGLNVDPQTLDIVTETQQHLDFEGQANIRKQYQEEIKQEFENSEDTEDVDVGVRKFRELIETGKLEIKAVRDKNIHAKL